MVPVNVENLTEVGLLALGHEQDAVLEQVGLAELQGLVKRGLVLESDSVLVGLVDFES